MPRIGPAHGAHSMPVATPSISDAQGEASALLPLPASRLPSATTGCVSASASLGTSSDNPNAASNISAL